MNRKLVITTAIILLASLLFFAVMIWTNNIGKLGEITSQEKDIVRASEPQFHDNGDLYFISKNNDTISFIDIEIAGTNETREQGLMFRKTMDEHKGMLFIFEQSTEQNFWMKNTYLSLDIIYTDDSMKIVSIHKNTKPFSEDLIPSQKPARYVVEVNAGYCDKNKIAEGDRIDFVNGN